MKSYEISYVPHARGRQGQTTKRENNTIVITSAKCKYPKHQPSTKPAKLLQDLPGTCHLSYMGRMTGNCIRCTTCPVSTKTHRSSLYKAQVLPQAAERRHSGWVPNPHAWYTGSSFGHDPFRCCCFCCSCSCCCCCGVGKEATSRFRSAA